MADLFETIVQDGESPGSFIQKLLGLQIQTIAPTMNMSDSGIKSKESRLDSLGSSFEASMEESIDEIGFQIVSSLFGI